MSEESGSSIEDQRTPDLDEESCLELEKVAKDSSGFAKVFLDCIILHSWILWWGFVMFNILCLAGMLVVTMVGERRKHEEWFWISFFTKTFILMVIQLIGGWGVETHGWKVGYTRKCVHIGFFLLPELLDILLPLPKEDAWVWALWNVLLISLMLLMITRPIRTRLRFVQIMYAAIDREEDRGLTMLYTLTQVPLTIVVIAGFSLFFQYTVDKQSWLLAPIIAVTFGDGLAEPVAVFWSEREICGGTHTYETCALCAGSRKFTRSYEGSACVVVFTAIGVVVIYGAQTTVEFVSNIVIMPVTMALLEAVAPHSMDNPFLITWGCVVMMISHGISQLFDITTSTHP
jgi:hypothetical protein